MRWIIAALVVALLTLAGCGTTTAGDAGAAGGDLIGTGKTADYRWLSPLPNRGTPEEV